MNYYLRIVYYLRLFATIVIVILLPFQSLLAQRYEFKMFNVENGLAQSQVFSLMQDSRGNMWFGTFGGGISKYNGKEFTTITTKDGLPSNTIYNMLEDKKNNIWILTNDGITRYTPTDLLSQEKEQQDSVSSSGKYVSLNSKNCNFIDDTGYFIYEDSEGNIWIGHRRGLSLLPHGANIEKEKEIFSNFTIKEGLIDSIVMCMVEDEEHHYWIGTYTGLMCVSISLDEKGKKIFNVIDTLTEKNGLLESYIKDLLIDKNGELLVLTKKGITKIDIKNSPKGNYSLKHYKGLDAYEKDRYLNFLEDSRGNLWLSSMGGGISKVVLNDESSMVDFKYSLNSNTGLPNDEVWNVIEDYEGNLWISVNGAGVAMYKGSRFTSLSVTEGLANNTVFSILGDNAGRYWFATYGGGISIYDPSKPEGKRFSVIDKSKGLPENYIYSIYPDKKGNYWMATRGVGITKYDGKSYKTYGTNEGMNSNFATGATEDSYGNVWVGTQRGLAKFVKDENGYKIYNFDKTNGLCDNIVYAVLFDSKENLWIGTTEGVNVIPKEELQRTEGEFTLRYFNSESGLADNEVLVLYEDSKDGIWIGTQGGVSVYNPEIYEKGFQSFTTDYGLASDLIYLIIEDNNGDMWFGTNKGVDRFHFNKQGLIVVTNFGKLEGFPGIETNHNAVYKDLNGNIWFGTIEGAIKYDPLEDRKNTAQPLTHITNLRVSFKDIELPADAEFSYYQNHITFDFISLSLSVPEKVKYQWKLEGFDDDWSPVSVQTSATYSNISPGKYTFKVIACNNDAVWNTTPASYSFHILPPFWQTWWFYTITLVTIVFSVYSFIRIRLRNLEKAKILLEQKVEERTRELSDANKEIQHQKIIVEQKNKDITASINYAHRIQDAILPKPKHLKGYFDDSFVLYKVKDVVSGDFPWILEKKDDIFISVIDCTGHGVPGAMLSMIGHFLLKEIVEGKNKIIPGEILDELHHGVNYTLRQDENLESRDGMDAAFCRINRLNNTIQYAGAHRCLYFANNGSVKEIPGNRFPIGGIQYSRRKKIIFDTHTLKYNKGDSIFFFSDGLPDQIGGPKNRKFLSTRVHKFINDNYKLPMNQFYEKINLAFEDWQGKNKQIDDVLMIGIRF